MRVTKQFPEHTYNERRFSKPWIAVVETWPVGGRPTLRWGSWLGKEGQVGELEIDANVGDVVKFGQKDYRKRSGTVSKFGVVHSNGTIMEVPEKEAREFFEAEMEKLVEEIQQPTRTVPAHELLGSVVVFTQGTTKEAAYEVLSDLYRRGILQYAPTLNSYNPDHGGPVWYIP